jgi:drug/metabolite transporter (DMT)-like permease
MTYVFSIILIIASNVCYNIVQKSTPSGVNPFAALLVTYVTAGLVVFTVLVITEQRNGNTLSGAFRGISWTSVALGVVIIGLEIGYLLAYRVGWDISKASLIANIALALILIPIGVIFYRETFSLQKTIGVFLCLAGLLLVNK